MQRPHRNDNRGSFRNAFDLADELERFLVGRGVQARPVGTLERAWRWCRRNTVVSVLGGAFVAALLGGTAASTFFSCRGGQAGARGRRANGKRQQRTCFSTAARDAGQGSS